MTPPVSLQTAAAYQYNYTYIESIAMAAALPEGEQFSEPWLKLVMKQFLRLAINTIIVNYGDQGKPGIEDDVRKIFSQTLLETLKEEGPAYRLKLVAALGSLLPQLIIGRRSLSPAGTRSAESIDPADCLDLADAELAVTAEQVEAALEQLLNPAVPTDVAVAAAQEVAQQPEPALPDLPSMMKVEVAATSVAAPRGMAPSDSDPAVANVEISDTALARGIEAALQKPLPGMPAHEAEAEQFVTSDLMKVLGKDFFKPFLANLLNRLKAMAPTGHVDSLAAYRQLFPYLPLPEIADSFQTDQTFAYLRVAGPNPIMLTRMTTADPRFPVTEAQYQSVMGADSLAEAMQDGRLYWVDFAVLDGAIGGTFGPRPMAQKYLYAPMALFAVPKQGGLLQPVAIQCGQSPDDYPIITPSTGSAAWLAAKTIVQIADVNFHEAVSHFARTHALLEPFVVTTHRQLPETHPLFKLLVPHFQGTMAINYAAHERLVAPTGGVNQLLSATIDNSRVLIVKGLRFRGFNADMLPRQLSDRGVDDSTKLPVYPYRDDGLLIWDAIHNWVTDYLSLYYADDAAVKTDRSLQAWAAELVALDGGRLHDLGDVGEGQIATLAYLIDAVTMIIFTASAQHAAVNFPQSDMMSFAPAMPTAGYEPAQTIGSHTTEADWFKLLPPLDQAQAQLNLLQLLGSVYFTQLGHYAADAFDDARVAQPLQAFQTRLQEIETKIDHRNLKRPTYNHLKPSVIPQSINI